MSRPYPIERHTDVTLLHCSWCGKLMTYDETYTSLVTYTGTNGGTLHLCFVDRKYVTTENLAVDGQLTEDKTFRDWAFREYISEAINPETSDEFSYPWY